MARYAFLFLDDGVDYQAAPTPDQQKVYADIFKWFETNGNKIIDGGAELTPTRTATNIRRVNGTMKVTEGPFIESKEHIGGFGMIEVPDLDAAIRVAKSWPGGNVEVRPIVVH